MSDADKLEAWRIIDLIRKEEGASVTICCDNPEPDSSENQCGIMILSSWSGLRNWDEESFYGKTVLAALQAALSVKEYKISQHQVTIDENKC